MSSLLTWIRSLEHKVIDFVFSFFGKECSDSDYLAIGQFLRFGIVGISNTAISYSIYSILLITMKKLCILPDEDYVIAQIIAFILSVLWSFFWNNKIVFTLETGARRNLWKTLAKTYVSYSFTGLFLNSILIVLWVEKLHISEFVAPIINLIVSVPLNFLINKFWAFKSEK